MLIHVRYDEIALKGKKRLWFEHRLRECIARQLDIPIRQIERTWGRMLIKLPDADDAREPLAALQRTFGVASAGVVRIVETWSATAPLEGVVPVALELAREAAVGRQTFKVETRRPDKTYPLSSYEVSRRLGAAVLEGVDGLTVDVHDPGFVLNVEVRPEGIALLTDSVRGPGGVPVGSGGKALALLSGGIDSPVAAWHMLKRGLHVDYVYFHAFPYTGDQVLEKVLTIARTLGRWTPQPLRVFVASTTAIQDAIAQGAPDPLRIVLLRRSMYRIANEILRARRKVKALVTGESLGQVASQTPENLLCVEAVVPDTLVLRPLAGFDKHEIVARAKAIGSFETSIQPYQDCCSLFAPRSPATRAGLKECQRAEAKLELAPLEQRSLEEVVVYKSDRGAPFDKTEEGIAGRKRNKTGAGPGDAPPQ